MALKTKKSSFNREGPLLKARPSDGPQEPGESDLRGKVAWVTGSSRGIGYAIAEALCQAGVNVALHGSNRRSSTEFGGDADLLTVAKRLGQTYGVRTMAVCADITSPAAVRRAVGRINRELGQIEILVCCAGGDLGAGGYGKNSGKPEQNDALAISLRDFKAVMDRNLMGVIYSCREVVPAMIPRKAGRIVTIGSQGGIVARGDLVAYRTAKAAMHHYTRCLAVQVRPANITANCVAVGKAASERWQKVYGQQAPAPEELLKATTLERPAHVAEIAQVVRFLCSSAAGYISGQVIRVDGGEQAFPA